jgi:RimJ/RimL family protein N-acetyltransferase
VKIEWEQNPERLAWVEATLQVKFPQSDVTWLSSVGEGGELFGVVVYSRFTASGCEMSVAAASPRFLSRNILRDFFSYPFLQLGKLRVTAVVEHTNAHSLQFNRRLGFRAEGLLRNWFGQDRHGIVLGMLKEECKWL